MSNSVKAAIITGVCSLLVGVIGAFSVSSVLNQNITVNINGEAVTVTAEQYKELIDENERLKNEITNIDKKDANKTGEDASVKKSDYLVYNIEPFSSERFEKVIDESINMGGNKYNNGFKLGGSYSKGYATYNLDGKYSEISGLIGYEDPGDEKDVTIEFWGDDALVKTHIVKSRDLPREFSVDLTGIRKFEIRIEDSWFLPPIDFAEIKIR